MYEYYGLQFREISPMCPESYDVTDANNNHIACVRLRWGHLHASTYTEVLYEAEIGNEFTGCFETEGQREQHLRNIAKALSKHIDKSKSEEESKGCWWCNNNSRDMEINAWTATEGVGRMGPDAVDFCPFCGRKLK